MKVVALDTETTGVGWTDTPFALSIYEPDRPPWEKFYYDWRENEDEWLQARDAVSWYVDHGYEFVFHNAKFDLRMLLNVGIGLHNRVVHDTQCLAAITDEHRTQSLKGLAREVLGLTTDEDDVLKVVRRKLKVKKEHGYAPIPREYVEPYAIKDAEFTYKLFRHLYPVVDANADLARLYEHEMQLLWCLLDIERYGLGVNVDYINEQIEQHEESLATLHAEATALMKQCPGLDSDTVNINSNPQLMKYLAWRGIETENTQRDTLEGIDDPLCALIVEYRTLSKIKQTYFVNMRDEQVNGVLHPNFRQFGTVTGRMSSGTATA